MNANTLGIGAAALVGLLIIGILVTEATVTSPEDIADPLQRQLAMQMHAQGYICADPPLVLLFVVASEVGHTARGSAATHSGSSREDRGNSPPSHLAALSSNGGAGSEQTWGPVEGEVTGFSIFRVPIIHVVVRHTDTGGECLAKFFSDAWS